ncbi:sulfotransferase [Colwelliaceae bacterium BS250]
MSTLNAAKPKIFIIGLPRTSTTSICLGMLDMGYTVSHTCYTQACLDDSEVIADTPVFTDYPLLDKLYPGSKFINLERDLALWIPSIKHLLQRMHTNVTRGDGGYNTHIKRCFSEVFTPFTLDNVSDDEFLARCYQQHQNGIEQYFQGRCDDLLSIDVSHAQSYQKLVDFLAIEQPIKGFQQVNMGSKVRYWKDIKHVGKIESTHNGRIDKDIYASTT